MTTPPSPRPDTTSTCNRPSRRNMPLHDPEREWPHQPQPLPEPITRGVRMQVSHTHSCTLLSPSHVAVNATTTWQKKTGTTRSGACSWPPPPLVLFHHLRPPHVRSRWIADPETDREAGSHQRTTAQTVIRMASARRAAAYISHITSVM